MAEVVFLEMTFQDEYDFIKEILNKVRLRERGYTEDEATRKILERFKQGRAIKIENETNSQRAKEKQDNR